MTGPVIYHGTPMTPRAALKDIGPGRAFCVSFWRPDDVEVVEAISPTIMFRQRGVLGMASGHQARGALVHPRGLDTVFRLAGAAFVSTRAVGSHSRCAGRAITDQRQLRDAVAVRDGKGRATLAHGWSDRATVEALRPVRPRVPRLDRDGKGQGCRVRGMVASHGRDRAVPREQMARNASHARSAGSARVSVRLRRRIEWS